MTGYSIFAHSRPESFRDCEAFASLYRNIIIGLSAKEPAQIPYPVIGKGDITIKNNIGHLISCIVYHVSCIK